MALGMALALALPVIALRAETLTPDQLRQAGVTALAAGDLPLTDEIARTLIEADPRDALAHYLRGMVYFRLGDAPAASREGRLAFRSSGSDLQRHQAARLTAGAALRNDQPAWARFWLRRAVEAAPTRAARQESLAALRALQEAADWRASARFSLSPSSNVNAGADSRYNTVDGMPAVGLLSGSAQALSGTVATLNAEVNRRLLTRPGGQLWLDARLYLKGVALSASARQQATQAPGGSGVLPPPPSDAFDSANAELALRWQQPRPRGSRVVQLTGGQSWEAGNRSFHYGEVALSQSHTLGARDLLSFGASGEYRWSERRADQDQRLFGLQAQWRHALPKGDILAAGVALRQADAGASNLRSLSSTVQLTWQPARPVGPFSGALSLGGSLTDYPDYIELALGAVPGGRQDRTLWADLDLWNPALAFAGFQPRVKLRALNVESNVSRFSHSEFSVNFGLRSAF
ncbi:tetratricopeptide repeat protein [Phaeovulum sp. W22_SRMD_FR3]|uniref:tetratricopeptide repeat protein n=1 Tax=Phaeovulum sp. W22_SRMD_FR3 TaxID=3240274 RepID=UPI003F996039